MSNLSALSAVQLMVLRVLVDRCPSTGYPDDDLFQDLREQNIQMPSREVEILQQRGLLRLDAITGVVKPLLPAYQALGRA